MKNLFSYLCLVSLFSTNTDKLGDDLYIKRTIPIKGVTITYKGFYAPVASYNSNQLIFTIKNDTDDTLYLSSNNIKVEVSKKGRIVKEDSLPKTGNLFPPDFLTDDIVLTTDIKHSMTCEEKTARVKLIEYLKKRFAKKLYNKNVIGKRKMNRDFFYSGVKNGCLVLFPHDQIKISRLFISAAMDNNCVVNAQCSKSNIFTSYVDENGNKIDVRN